MNGLPDRTYTSTSASTLAKKHHHACTLAPTGKRRHDKVLPQDTEGIRAS